MKMYEYAVRAGSALESRTLKVVTVAFTPEEPPLPARFVLSLRSIEDTAQTTNPDRAFSKQVNK